MRQRGTLNNTMNKPTTAEDKARHRETIGNLAKELSNIQSNYRTTQYGGESGGQSARKLGQTQSSLGVAQSQSLSARGGSKSPNSGPASAAEKTPGARSGGSKIGQGFGRRSTVFPSNLGSKQISDPKKSAPLNSKF